MENASQMLEALKLGGQHQLGAMKGRNDGSDMQEIHHQAHAVRKKRLEDGLKDDQDWSEKYRMFDDWVAEEEYQERIEQEKAKQEAEQKRKFVGGCNHDHSAERQLMEMSVDDKLNACEQFRLEGNAWFQEGQYYRASERYRKVIVYLDYTFPDNDRDLERMTEVKLPALINLTTCCLKMKDYAGVLENAPQVLDIDAKNTKALYASAKAYRQLDRFEEASSTIRQAIELEPDNNELRKELAFLKNKIARYKHDSARRAKAMFSSSSSANAAAPITSLPPSPPESMTSSERSQQRQHPLLSRHIDQFDEFQVIGEEEEEFEEEFFSEEEEE